MIEEQLPDAVELMVRSARSDPFSSAAAIAKCERGAFDPHRNGIILTTAAP
jgi:hypothetical protein